ncbi:hypothetical protein [Stella sp.]|uniref:hypothetical protein n=1 Tax=Stella sp. TaxID=2912054 RepID=UPI0035B46DD9
MADIVFVNGIATPPVPKPGQVLDSPVASVRLRCLLPAAGLRALGHRTSLAGLTDLVRPGIAERLRDPAVRIVLGKPTPGTFAGHPEACTAALDVLERLAEVRPVHADVCDLLTERHGPAGRHRDLVLRRFVPVVASQWLADHYRPTSRHAPLVVEDPTETPVPAAPRFRPAGPLRFVWFGYWSAGTGALLGRALSGLAPEGRDIRLTIVTQPAAAADIDRLARTANDRVDAPCRVERRDWSPAEVGRALADADFVLLPQPAGDPRVAAKSHNRMVEAIRHGRFALASPIPAYRELADFGWVGDPAEGVRWALAQPDRARARIAAGQAAVADRFSPEAVARRWAAALALPATG